MANDASPKEFAVPLVYTVAALLLLLGQPRPCCIPDGRQPSPRISCTDAVCGGVAEG